MSDVSVIKKRLVTIILLAVMAMTLLLILFIPSMASEEKNVPTVSATVNGADEACLDIVASNLQYGDYIYIVYAVDSNLPEGIEASEVRMLFWNGAQENYTLENGKFSYVAGVDGEVNTTGNDISINGAIVYEDCIVFSSFAIPPKQFADTMYARAYVVDDDGKIYYSNVVKYSVFEYVYSRYEDKANGANVTDAQLNLYGKVLNYGAMAQIVLEYRTDRLANGAASYIKIEGGHSSDGFNGGYYLAGDTLTVVADDGEGFTGWVNGKGEIIGTEKSITVTVTADHDKETFKAVFAHNYTSTVVAPTCEEDGYTKHVCTYCGDTYTTDIKPAIGHSIVDWYISEQVSLTSDGVMRKGCENCDKHEVRAFEVIASGNLGVSSNTTPGTNVTYKIFEDGTLKLYGTGESFDCKYNGSTQPFRSYASGIKRVVVSEGITAVGRGAFASLPKLEEAILPTSLTMFKRNIFMDSFVSTMTSYTIPAHITTIEYYVLGRYTASSNSALFTDIIIENPNVTFTDKVITFNDGSNPGLVTLYSYGSDNNVSKFAAAYGFKYVDLNHEHEYEEVIVAPTCETEGYTKMVCSVCGHSYNTDTKPAFGHSKDDQWYVSQKVDLISDGVMRWNCINCDKYEERAFEVIASGNLGVSSTTTPGTNVTYKIFEDGTLKLYGTGESFDCKYNGSTQPFRSYASGIKRVVVSEGITAVGRGAFASLPKLEEAILPTSLTMFKRNIFMDSFVSTMTSYTIPAHITTIEYYVLGRYTASSNSALFTDIIIENPNVTFTDKVITFNDGSNPGLVTLYSYGSDNNVSKFAAAYGFNYVDLNSVISGTVGNVNYNLNDGKLTLSAKDASASAALPSDSPWLDRAEASSITEIVIGEGITEIPDGYFKDYTSLTSVSMANTVTSIGAEAFATSASNATPLLVILSEKIASIATDFLKNRSGVTVNGVSGTAAETVSGEGITVNIKQIFRLLLIGNSLSLDAADCTRAGTTSQLYNILKAMLGEDSIVEIGVLYSGSKTAAWHATSADQERALYSFYFISESTGEKWTVTTNTTSKYGLTYADWTAVTLQPYGTETRTGVSSLTADSDGADKDEKFLPLTVSLPYLIEYVGEYAPKAEIYYYMIWWANNLIELDVGYSKFNNTLLPTAKTAYAAVNEGEFKFDGFLPIGTALQNARSTYLALNYDTNSVDPQYNLQRDSVHLSYTIGRYIVGLSFAELLIPESRRAEGYVVPGVRDSDTVGELPAEYTAIAKLAVEAMLATAKTDCSFTRISGYTEEPSAKYASEIADKALGVFVAESEAELIAMIESTLLEGAKDGIRITAAVENGITLTEAEKEYQISVTVQFGYLKTVITKTVIAKLG